MAKLSLSVSGGNDSTQSGQQSVSTLSLTKKVVHDENQGGSPVSSASLSQRLKLKKLQPTPLHSQRRFLPGL
jgi:hypothetical protein